MNRTAKILLAFIVGLIAIGAYRSFSNAQSPLNFRFPIPSGSVVNNQTQTVVQEENAIINVVDQTSPSVVAIAVNRQIVNPFDPFSAPQQQEGTIGTGFVVDGGKGVIATNRHVVSDTDGQYSVVSKDGKRYEIDKIYRDPTIDLALVQVKNSDLKTIPLGDSSQLKVGQVAIAIGNALGRLDNTVTTGIVSGIGRSVTAGDPFGGSLEQLDNLIQTDAAINPGNSGGPLLNSAGQVIGINVATSEGAQNIGFAIPINAIKNLVNEFVSTGTITRPFLGVQYRIISRDLALLNEVPQGAYLQQVVPDSPAAKAGLQTGDIITKIDNQSLNEENPVAKIIQGKKVGDTVTLTVWRDGQTSTINATLENTPSQ